MDKVHCLGEGRERSREIIWKEKQIIFIKLDVKKCEAYMHVRKKERMCNFLVEQRSEVMNQMHGN